MKTKLAEAGDGKNLDWIHWLKCFGRAWCCSSRFWDLLLQIPTDCYDRYGKHEHVACCRRQIILKMLSDEILFVNATITHCNKR